MSPSCTLKLTPTVTRLPVTIPADLEVTDEHQCTCRMSGGLNVTMDQYPYLLKQLQRYSTGTARVYIAMYKHKCH